MGVAQRHHVVNVEFAWVRHDGVRVWGQPLAARDATPSVGSVGNCGPAFGYQHLVASVLAVAIGVRPVFSIVAVVVRQVIGDLGDRHVQDVDFRLVDGGRRLRNVGKGVVGCGVGAAGDVDVGASRGSAGVGDASAGVVPSARPSAGVFVAAGFVPGLVALDGWTGGGAGSVEHAMSTAAAMTATTAASFMVIPNGPISGVYRACGWARAQKRRELSHEVLWHAMTRVRTQKSAVVPSGS